MVAAIEVLHVEVYAVPVVGSHIVDAIQDAVVLAKQRQCTVFLQAMQADLVVKASDNWRDLLATYYRGKFGHEN